MEGLRRKEQHRDRCPLAPRQKKRTEQAQKERKMAAETEQKGKRNPASAGSMVWYINYNRINPAVRGKRLVDGRPLPSFRVTNRCTRRRHGLS